jgi:hypothetical protein
MSGTEIEQSESSREEIKQEPAQTSENGFNVSEIIKWELDNPVVEPSALPQRLSTQMEKFSNLSSDITKLLSELFEEVQNSLTQVQSVQSAVDLKKNELKALHDIDVSATAMEKLIEDHRLQRENLENLMKSQRNAWEEEKAERIQEEKEYLENLKSRRQREEEEYGRIWAAEQQQARQQLEEELQAARQKSLEERDALDMECLEREEILKEKETEWIKLVQELEAFVSKLAGRSPSQASAGADSNQEASSRFTPKDLPNPDF